MLAVLVLGNVWVMIHKMVRKELFSEILLRGINNNVTRNDGYITRMIFFPKDYLKKSTSQAQNMERKLPRLC